MPCHAKPSQSSASSSQDKDQNSCSPDSRAETKRSTMERESCAGPPMAEECPLELSLSILGAQGSSASAGEGTVERLRGRPAWSVLDAFERRGVEVLAATLARHGRGEGTVADTVVTVTAPSEVLEMIRADIACIH